MVYVSDDYYVLWLSRNSDDFIYLIVDDDGVFIIED